MILLVKKTFRDKGTGVMHEAGTLYETNNKKRVDELRKGGFLGVELTAKEEPKLAKQKDGKK